MPLKETSKCCGYQQITSLSASTGLTVPTDANTGEPNYCLIVAQTQGVRWRDDGTAPTASVGMPLDPGVPFAYDGDLNKIRFIEVTASAALNISFYR
jgi:hypothetical protein